MKYLLRDKKVEFSGDKKQLIAYVKEHYKDEYWVCENSKKFDTDFGSFIAVGKGNCDWNNSGPHGAGRVLS